jgi:hypothetical protein
MRFSIRPALRVGVLIAAVVAIVAVVIPASGVAAGRVLFHSHENFSDTFPDNICGIDGTSVVKGVDDFWVYANDLVKDNVTLDQVFTATASGKAVRIHVAQQFTSNDQPIDNGDGTVTFIDTFKGLPEQLKIDHGPVLSRDAGNVTLVRIFDGTTGDFISQTVSSEKGPHPDLDSDFAVFCDVLIPALT